MSRRITAFTPVTLLVLIAGTIPLAVAQELLVAPQPVSRPQPEQPTNADGDPVEGWAIVRFSVLEDGSTDLVRVIDIVPSWADPAPTIAAVENWTFVPGMRDGGAIDWHNNESVIEFSSPDSNRTESPTFKDAYFEIAAILDEPAEDDAPTTRSDEEFASDLAMALKANQDLLRRDAMLAEEFGVAMLQAAIINIGLDDNHSAYHFARLATDPRIDALSGDDLFVALQIRLQIEAQLGRVQDALATFERIAAGFGPDDTNPFAQAADSLRDNWENEEIVQVLGRIDESPWRIDAGRRIFTIDNIDGRVTSIEAECDSRRLTLTYQPEVDWQIPENLGECALFVSGDSGTSFSFFAMLPAE